MYREGARGLRCHAPPGRVQYRLGRPRRQVPGRRHGQLGRARQRRWQERPARPRLRRRTRLHQCRTSAARREPAHGRTGLVPATARRTGGRRPRGRGQDRLRARRPGRRRRHGPRPRCVPGVRRFSRLARGNSTRTPTAASPPSAAGSTRPTAPRSRPETPAPALRRRPLPQASSAPASFPVAATWSAPAARRPPRTLSRPCNGSPPPPSVRSPPPRTAA